MWKCTKCETNNNDDCKFCMICNYKKEIKPKTKSKPIPTPTPTPTQIFNNIPINNPIKTPDSVSKLDELEPILEPIHDEKAPKSLKIILLTISILLIIMIIAVVLGIIILI